MTAVVAGTGGRRTSWKRDRADWSELGGSALELLGLTSVAITQPLLDTFGKAPELFIARGARQQQVIAFGLIIAFAPALVLVAVEVLLGLVDRRLARWAHYGAVALLTAAIAVQIAKHLTDQGSKVLSLIAFVAAVGGVLLIRRASLARTFVRFLAVASVAFLAMFLLGSSVSTFVTDDAEVRPQRAAVGRPAPVVWIVLDELPIVSLMGPDNQIDAQLFPNLAELQQDSTWYRNHTTVAPDTTDAVPAMLTGKYPRNDDHPLPVVQEHPENLFTLLGSAYDLNVSEGWTQLCPSNLCPDLAGGARDEPLAGLVGDAMDLWGGLVLPNRFNETLGLGGDIFRFRSRQISEFAESLPGASRSQLNFLHVVLPHGAFEFLPSGQRYSGPADPFGIRGSPLYGKWSNEDFATIGRQRHLLQLQHTDRLIGEIFDRLRAVDRYDDALIVLTADHGAGFTPGHPFRGPTEGNYHEIMWTPLFIKGPRQGGARIDDRPIRSIDILPVVADMLALDIPWDVDGRADPDDRPPPDRLPLLRWGLNLLTPANGDSYVTINGRAGFERVLSADPVPPHDDAQMRVFRSGRFGDLIGTPIEQFDRGGETVLEGRFESEAFDDVELDGDPLPLFPAGEIASKEARGYDVAVAVNGRFAGAVRAIEDQPLEFVYRTEDFPTPRRRRWGIMIPPSMLREGSNRLELFVAEGEPDDLRLHPLRLQD